MAAQAGKKENHPWAGLFQGICGGNGMGFASKTTRNAVTHSSDFVPFPFRSVSICEGVGAKGPEFSALRIGVLGKGFSSAQYRVNDFSGYSICVWPVSSRNDG